MAIQQTNGLSLKPQQLAAFKALQSFVDSNSQFFRLTGYAGTGKTFLVIEFVKWLKANNTKFVVAAPTNKAAKNIEKMAQASGIVLEAETIARLLGQIPEIDEIGREKFVSKKGCSLSDYEVAIIDEYSMIGKDNFTEICFQVGASTKVIFVGDDAQLPPIGEKVSTVSLSGVISAYAALTEIVRYEGQIVKVAEEIRSNPIYDRVIYPFRQAPDGTINVASDRVSWLYQAANEFTHPSWKDNPNQCRILVFRNRTAVNLNSYVRRRIYGDRCKAFELGDLLIARFPCFRENADKKSELRMVVQNSEEMKVTGDFELKRLSKFKQNYGYYQVPVLTESGRDIDLHILTPESQQIFDSEIERLQRNGDYKAKWWLFKTFDHCPFAYSLTTHKAQGSSIDKVFIDVDDMASCKEKQKILYTALTRAKQGAFVY